MPEPRLSVIIPTLNRHALLAKTLDSLAAVSGVAADWEVIVVDDGSQDQTADMLRQRQDPFQVTVIRNAVPRGPAAARNQGAAAARAKILGFLDSDVIVDPHWWQAAAPHFADPEVAGVEGATSPPSDAPRPGIFTHVVSNRAGGNFITCNVFYRTEVFRRLGGFDERFKKANREDSDFAFTVLEQGLKIIFESRSRVEHPLFPAPRNVYFKEARYGLHEALLRRKHPGMYKKYLKWIDGRAFPVFYWGLFLGAPVLAAGLIVGSDWMLAAGAAALGLGWTGTVYALCRRRGGRPGDLLLLAAQMLAVPWVRLVWVLAGEWKYRRIKPEKVK